MTPISHFIEPSRLLLVWQQPIHEADGIRSRRIIGEIIRVNDNQAEFRYLTDSLDYKNAEKEGFLGYPAFRTTKNNHEVNVLAAFTCRLPSRKRNDFKDYLAAHGLPDDFSGSDFSLLAHTGAKLPGDGFEIIPDLAEARPPFDLIIEVAGTRHQKSLVLDEISVGDHVNLFPEPNNQHDKNAIEVIHKTAGRLGYIPKPYCSAFQKWLDMGILSGRIFKLNGRPDRRLVYLQINIA